MSLSGGGGAVIFARDVEDREAGPDGLGPVRMEVVGLRKRGEEANQSALEDELELAREGDGGEARPVCEEERGGGEGGMEMRRRRQ